MATSTSINEGNSSLLVESRYIATLWHGSEDAAVASRRRDCPVGCTSCRLFAFGHLRFASIHSVRFRFARVLVERIGIPAASKPKPQSDR